jgi:hypothetical protein
MNGEVFEDWLHNVPHNAVLVMDRAPYHTCC